MFLYFIAIVVIFLVWQAKDFVGHDILKDFSNTSVPLLKNSINFIFSTPEEIFAFPRNCARKFGKSYRHMFFVFMSFEICRAREVEKVLGTTKHIDKSNIYDILNPFLKTGLLTSKGEKWHQRRRMLTPAFHFDILKEFFDVFKEESEKLVERLQEKVEKVVDIIPISSQFTLNTICESAMGVKLSDLGNNGLSYRANIYLVGKMLVYRLLRIWLFFGFISSITGYTRELNLYLKPVHEFTKSIIAQRKLKYTSDKQSKEPDKPEDSENIYFRSKKRRYAMMDTLLQAQSNGLIDDEGIREETDTFTFEGHDTTSAAMTFTLLLLAHHPEAQERIFEEIEEVLNGDDIKTLTIDDVNKMEYLDRVIKESLRIYPPVPFISREFSEKFHHDGVTYQKGDVCNVHIYDLHRDPDVFPDPESFNPDRFLPENCVNRSNFAFIAFSAGMRNCIGQRFAMMELKVVLANLLSSFKVLPVTTREQIIFIADLVLRSKHPIKLIFKNRI